MELFLRYRPRTSMRFHLLTITTLVGLVVFTAPLPSLHAQMETEAAPTIIDRDGFIPEDLPITDAPYSEDDRVVIGRDNRAPVLTSAYPYSTIGRIDWVLADGRSLGYCTGTLIGRDLVLTNSHCLIHPQTDRVINPEQYAQGRDKIVFKPNLIRGEAPAVAEVVTFEYGWGNNPGQAAADWAILKLDRPLGDEFGYLGWVDLDLTNPQIIDAVKGKIRIAGYAGDFPTPNLREFGQAGDTAGQHDGCSILEGHDRGQFAGLFFHACDTNPGASGSALLGHWEAGVYVVLGLHAGANELDREVDLPTGDRSRYLNRGVRVMQWADTAAQMREE